MNTAHPAPHAGRTRRRGEAARAAADTASQRPGVRRPQNSEVRVRIRGVGSMAVGSAEAIGTSAVGFARGDRVVFPISRDERASLGDTHDAAGGALLVGADRLLGVPRDVGDEQAARLLAPGLVARVLLRQLRPVKTGDRVRIDLPHGIVRAVLAGWARALGAAVVEDQDPAEVILDEDALRQAHAIAFRHGHLQAGSADVFAAIRSGSFDGVLAAAADTEAAA